MDENTEFFKTFDEKASEYVRFVATHKGQHPRGHVPEEHSLAGWAINAGTAHVNGELSEHQSRTLLGIPEWSDTETDRRWFQRLREYEIWCDSHAGVPPRMNGAGSTAHERVLGVWASWQRVAMRGNPDGVAMRDRERKARILNERVPGLLNNGWRKWDHSLRLYAAWVLAHGKRPNSHGAEKMERRMAGWMARQQDMFSMDRLHHDRELALNTTVPSWADGVDRSWGFRLSRYESFIERNHGCAPRDGTGNKFEQFMFEWWSRQQSAITDGVMDTERMRLFMSVAVQTSHTPSCRHLNPPRCRR